MSRRFTLEMNDTEDNALKLLAVQHHAEHELGLTTKMVGASDKLYLYTTRASLMDSPQVDNL